MDVTRQLAGLISNVTEPVCTEIHYCSLVLFVEPQDKKVCAAAHLGGTVEEAEGVHFTPGLRWGFTE